VQHGKIFGLALALACTPKVESGVPYEGSCPILIECADVLGADEQLYRSAYGTDGDCWANGSNYWQECRDSCVGELLSINVLAQSSFGGTCGTCESDSDCASFGADTRCEGSWCARPQLGADDGSSQDGETETEAGETDDSSGEVNMMGDACEADVPVVVIDTNYGAMTFELDRVAAPTVTSLFLDHVRDDFYDNTIVHRVIDGLSLQSGVYAQGPALRMGAVAKTISTLPELSHDDGVLALVVDGDTVAAQWYVTDGAHPELDGSGAVFGRLLDGLSIRDQISAVEVGTFSWMGYLLLNFPTDEIVVNDVYCVVP
jgi:cyclophilin family peptidyl-prolyl cis-trans isomerase